MTIICEACKNNITLKKKRIKCCNCLRLYHSDCIKFKKSASRPQWKCSLCVSDQEGYVDTGKTPPRNSTTSAKASPTIDVDTTLESTLKSKDVIIMSNFEHILDMKLKVMKEEIVEDLSDFVVKQKVIDDGEEKKLQGQLNEQQKLDIIYNTEVVNLPTTPKESVKSVDLVIEIDSNEEVQLQPSEIESDHRVQIMQEVANSEKESNDDLPLDKPMKHPLNNSWSFWMFTNEKKKSWEDNLVKLTTFDTVEDYWCLYHWMKLPSELVFGQDYAVFKNDIRPMWEDDANRKGGRLLLNFEKKRNVSLDTAWSYVVLFMIGENFANSSSICGAVVNVRVKSKIGIWVTDAQNERANLEIGQRLKDQLHFNTRITFHVHNSVNNLFTI